MKNRASVSMENLLGLLRIHIHRGVNLAVRDVSTSDPYVIVRMGKQFLVVCCAFAAASWSQGQTALSEASNIMWENDKVVQKMVVRLQNVERGEVELELNWIDIPGSKVLERTLLSEALHHRVKLAGGDLPVLILVVQVEGVSEILVLRVGSSVAGAVESRELLHIDESVAVSIDLQHYALHLLRRRLAAERIQNRAELGQRDFAVAVRVKLPEHLLHFRHRAARNHRRFRIASAFCHYRETV
nr:protein C2-DOMAIN ABA-RELATED 4-like [Ipomoea batatas]